MSFYSQNSFCCNLKIWTSFKRTDRKYFLSQQPSKNVGYFFRHVPIEIWFLKQTIKVLNQNSEDSNFMNTFILNEQNYLPIGECTQINKFGGASHRKWRHAKLEICRNHSPFNCFFSFYLGSLTQIVTKELIPFFPFGHDVID